VYWWDNRAMFRRSSNSGGEAGIALQRRTVTGPFGSNLLPGLILVIPLLFAPWSQAEAPSESPLILMLLWRGMTDAESGFQDYFESNHIPVRYEIWNANKNKAALEAFIKRIPALKPDLIYTFGTTVTLQLTATAGFGIADYATELPLVFNIVADPWGAGLATKNPEFANRQIKVTGVSHSVPVDAQLRAIRELDKFHSIAALYNPEEKNARLAVKSLQESAVNTGLVVESVEITEQDLSGDMRNFVKKLSQLKEKGIRLAYIPSDSLLISRANAVISKLHKLGFLTFSATETPIRRGGALIGIVSRYRNVGQLAAYKARQILFDGKEANTIPIETLSRFSFIVNMKAARQLDYYPPVTMMQFAEVIQ
jgi:putative tryptophan/tyrosine transport system substrate-binding protein